MLVVAERTMATNSDAHGSQAMLTVEKQKGVRNSVSFAVSFAVGFAVVV